MLSGLFVGMVLGLQGYELLQRFGSEEALGTAAAIGLVKELGPVVTALLFAGRAGTALASELGLMRATDQISAMEMMAVDPIQRVVVPRFLGGVIAMPLLAAIFSVIGIYGAQLVGVQIMGVDAGSFWSQMRASVSFSDVNEGIVKSCIFGVACSLIAVYQGYHATPDRRGRGPRHHAHRGDVRGGDFVLGLFDYSSIFVGEGMAMRKSRTLNLGTGTVCAARVCGAVFPDHADHQPRTVLHQSAALRRHGKVRQCRRS